MGRPKKFKTPQDLEALCDEYFDYCDEMKKPYSVTGLAVYLNTWKDVLIDYASGIYDAKVKIEGKKKYDIVSYSNVLKRVRARIEADMEEGATTGKRRETFTIFALKNHFGWQDKQEIDVTGTQIIVGDGLSKFSK